MWLSKDSNPGLPACILTTILYSLYLVSGGRQEDQAVIHLKNSNSSLRLSDVHLERRKEAYIIATWNMPQFPAAGPYGRRRQALRIGEYPADGDEVSCLEET
jgi:hypothetical protein